jgi:hypothetical protein
MRTVFSFLALTLLVSGCSAVGDFFPDFDPSNSSSGSRSMPAPVTSHRSMTSSSIRPEVLVNCRGHVLVPAIGMAFVPMGGRPPPRGQYLREESLTAPYRVLPPGAAATMDYVPSRLNIDLDNDNRVINIRCG